MNDPSKTVGIIGAGISGLSCAARLSAQGAKCVVFDKGRGPGGRMATRRVNLDERVLRFDHGAQFFTARDPRFAEKVRQWQNEGAAARWAAVGEDVWVGTPSMNAPLRALATGQHVYWGCRVERLEPFARGWRIVADDQVADVDQIVCALPAEQAALLLRDVSPEIASMAAAVRSEPCWAAMLAFDHRLGIDHDCATDLSEAIGWAARDGAKPGRSGVETWVVHATSNWSAEHLDEPSESVAASLAKEFFAATGISGAHPFHAQAHRWLYARPDVGHPCDFVWNEAAGVGACGDWLLAPRVESAWLSGHLLAEAMSD